MRSGNFSIGIFRSDQGKGFEGIMGFFARLFRKQANRAPALPPEFLQAQQCLREAEELKNADRYIARSDYIPLRDRYKDTDAFFRNMQKSGMLGSYCKKNQVEEKTISSFLHLYQDLTDLKKGSAVFRGHNEAYVARHLREEKEYLDNILKEVDPAILLDEEQRRAVLCDEDHMLVIEGCGDRHNHDRGGESEIPGRTETGGSEENPGHLLYEQGSRGA